MDNNWKIVEMASFIAQHKGIDKKVDPMVVAELAARSKNKQELQKYYKELLRHI